MNIPKRPPLYISVGVIFILFLLLIAFGVVTLQKNSITPSHAAVVALAEPNTLEWKSATLSAPWETRDSGEAFIFEDKLWLIGGLDGNAAVQKENYVEYWKAPHFNDIWNTKDGIHWEQVASSSAWPVRRSMSVAFFKGKLWMFGGWSPVGGYTSDIWTSEDGIHWSRTVENAPWPPREGQMVEVFQDKLWLIGGVNYDDRETKNDVWYSEDGIHWTLAEEHALWSSRWDHATEVFDGKLFVVGGMDLTQATFKDVWSSEDGINWKLVTDNPPWESRQGHALERFQGKLWLIGRLNDTLYGGVNDVWYSDDGVVWKKTDTDPEWSGREDFFSAVFKNKLWVFGGMNSSWRWEHDVWFSDFPEVE